MRSRLTAAAVLLASVALLGFGARQLDRAAARDMASAADAFLDALSEEQRARAHFGLDSDERTRWHFVPTEMFPRRGVVLKELDERQTQAAHDLLRTGLSQHGYATATAIMELENVLRELEQGGRFERDAEAYYVSIFGTPEDGGTWAWRFEGHHLSLHFTTVDGAVTVSTPTFFGANPAEVRQGPRRGQRALAETEDAARALLQSLDEGRRGEAVLSDTAPSDILRGPDVPAEPLDPVGLVAARMTPAQRSHLRSLLEAHTSVMAEEIAEKRWSRIDDAGFDEIGFAWAGDLEPGGPHYYRIQGPTFLVEHDNTQNDANHIHQAWRDFDGDFGRDLLREHLGSVPH